MPSRVSGTITASFLFDVAETVDLIHVQRLINDGVPALLAPKLTTPAYVQYRQPPIAIDGRAVDVSDSDGRTIRFKAFDYGVISVAFSHALAGTWDEWLADGLACHDGTSRARDAERLVRRLIDRIHPAMTRPRATFLAEDYLVFAVTEIDPPLSADTVLSEHGGAIAQLLRGERLPLSSQERDEVLRHHLSYFANDLVVPTWSSAFVFDTDQGARAAVEILEFANSQLLEFRYYDQLLDSELNQIYPQLQHAGWRYSWLAGRHARAARHVHSLFIDVNELIDKTENALKIVGDVYAARLFALATARLGLSEWKASVRGKLTTLGDISRFAVEHTSLARGEVLELTIVLILVFELVLLLTGVMQ